MLLGARASLSPACKCGVARRVRLSPLRTRTPCIGEFLEYLGYLQPEKNTISLNQIRTLTTVKVAERFLPEEL